ncbi:hypothetical protein BS78_03G367000 [Paspalum vaginatum]|nr:hypothetical protein BS78_03G367000 [Paspalum vaginatum]
MESSKSKRRRGQNGERCTCSHGAKREEHLYLVLDDWKAAPERTPMAFAALGTNIFVSTNKHCSRHQAPPFLVYDTATAALSIGPRPPDGYLRDLGDAVAVSEKLYALTLVGDELRPSTSLQVLSWAPTPRADRLEAWDPTMAWLWNSAPTTSPFMARDVITSYCLHPDGRTIFMSTDWRTHSVDTSNGVWRDLGEWTLPFRGRAYFDDGLDAWVGLCREHDGYVCRCAVGSRSAMATQQPECWMLKEKLFRRGGEGKRQRLGATLTYMGDSNFCLVENVLRSEDALDAVLNVTLFGLKYDRKGELQTKTHRTTKSYALSKNTTLFSHAAFWM